MDNEHLPIIRTDLLRKISFFIRLVTPTCWKLICETLSTQNSYSCSICEKKRLSGANCALAISLISINWRIPYRSGKTEQTRLILVPEGLPIIKVIKCSHAIKTCINMWMHWQPCNMSDCLNPKLLLTENLHISNSNGLDIYLKICQKRGRIHSEYNMLLYKYMKNGMYLHIIVIEAIDDEAYLKIHALWLFSKT